MTYMNSKATVLAVAIGAAGAIHCAANASDPCAAAWNTAFNHEGLEGETIYALAVHDGDLIIGGSFSASRGGPANHIARWDGSQWQPLGAGTNGDVRSLLVHDGDLYVGGFFTEAGGQTVNHIARWDGENWHQVGSGFNNAVMVLGVHFGDIVAGGLFTHAGFTEVNRIAMYVSNMWIPIGGANGMVVSLGEHDGWLIVGGRFTEIGGVGARNVAGFHMATGWQLLGGALPDGESAEGPINPVWALASDASGRLMLGGSFIYIQPQGIHPFDLGSYPDNLTMSPQLSLYGGTWEAWDWTLIAPPSAVPNRIIRSLLRTNADDLIAGGDFTRIGDDIAARLARWEGNEWKSIGHGVGGPLTSAVYDMAEFNGEIIVAGYFTEAAGENATSIAGWDGTTSAGPADLNCDGIVDASDLVFP